MSRRRSSFVVTAWAATTLAACTVDTNDLAPIDDYPSWYSVETRGEVPGHGDGVRVIYVNDVARGYPGVGRYPVGSVLVKEVRGYADDGGAGELKYLAIMRKLGDDADAPDGADIEGGWVFTTAGELGATEKRGLTCWNTCHLQAPIDGLYLVGFLLSERGKLLADRARQCLNAGSLTVDQCFGVRVETFLIIR